jgi:hypothetical protein
MEKEKLEMIKSQSKMVLDNLKTISDMIVGNKELVMENRNMVDYKECWDLYDRLNLTNNALLRASADVDEAMKWLKRVVK